MSFLLADSGTAVAPGSYGGLTATSNATANGGEAWSILLSPAS